MVINIIAEFDFYIEGKVNGIKVNIYFQISALVIEELSSNILLRMDFLCNYNIKFNFNIVLYSFRFIFSIKV
ncbi:hypothetical protein QBC45DRAFT_340775 [Copromyces sp. CBS 386.78]|nr:hypothetical protein QBC45DRAFT_340775 [Copromyces sp. CBS 386.78]